jgi:hypothetical protein
MKLGEKLNVHMALEESSAKFRWVSKEMFSRINQEKNTQLK